MLYTTAFSFLSFGQCHVGYGNLQLYNLTLFVLTFLFPQENLQYLQFNTPAERAVLALGAVPVHRGTAAILYGAAAARAALYGARLHEGGSSSSGHRHGGTAPRVLSPGRRSQDSQGMSFLKRNPIQSFFVLYFFFIKHNFFE